MTSIPTIETARLRLRAPERRDFEAYAAMWADERTTRFIGGEPRTRNQSWLRFLGTPGLWALMGYGYWTFADRESDELVGVGGLSFFDRGMPELEGHVEAGWAIAPGHWGKGLVTEAMTAALTWGDEVLKAPEIRCIIDPGNTVSERVAAKLGFAFLTSSELAGQPTNVYARPRRRGGESGAGGA